MNTEEDRLSDKLFNYLRDIGSLVAEKIRARFQELSFEDRLLARRLEQLKYYKPENKVEDFLKEVFSDSNKYKLVINKFNTKPGCWQVTLGQIFDSNGKLIDKVYRNYHGFPYKFIEDHPNGHDYLICGEDYQGQTIIELDTGKRFDNIPGVTNNEFGGFCWVNVNPSPNKKLLLVDGCYWASSYQYKIYDFSDPLSVPKSVGEINHEDIQEAEWIDDSSCKLTIEYEWCILKNKRTRDLTDEEEEEVEELRKNDPDKNFSKFYKDMKEDRIWKHE